LEIGKIAVCGVNWFVNTARNDKVGTEKRAQESQRVQRGKEGGRKRPHTNERS